MRAVDHYVEAVRLLDAAPHKDGGSSHRSYVAQAQVHATLALAGATALQAYSKGDEAELDDWEFHAGGEQT